MEPCPNCGAERSGRYCSECGQDNLRARLDSRVVLTSTFQNLVGWDTALSRTLTGLLLRPGRLAADYASGQRRRYVNPARFCLLALALWFFVGQAAGIDVLDSTGFQFQLKGESGAQNQIAADVKDFLGANLNILLYLSLPVLALYLRLLFRSKERNLAECLVLVLYLAGFRFLFATLLYPLEFQSPEWARLMRISIEVLWTVWAGRVFFEVGTWTAVWRVSLAKVLHMITTLLGFGVAGILWMLFSERL